MNSYAWRKMRLCIKSAPVSGASGGSIHGIFDGWERPGPVPGSLPGSLEGLHAWRWCQLIRQASPVNGAPAAVVPKSALLIQRKSARKPCAVPLCLYPERFRCPLPRQRKNNFLSTDRVRNGLAGPPPRPGLGFRALAWCLACLKINGP